MTATGEAPVPGDGPDHDERVAYLEGLARKRGYVLPQYGVLANYDLDVLKAIDQVSSTVYLVQRRLSRVTKEIIFMITFTMQRMPVEAIANHVTMALEHGADPQELLEAIEMLIPHAGIPTFSLALEAWTTAVGAQRLEVDIPHGDTGLLDNRPAAPHNVDHTAV